MHVETKYSLLTTQLRETQRKFNTFREQNDFEKEVFMGESKPAGKVNDALYSWIQEQGSLRQTNIELKARIQKLEGEIQRNNQVLAKPSHQVLPRQLQTLVSTKWPTRHSRYTRVKVLLVQWESDDLGATESSNVSRKSSRNAITTKYRSSLFQMNSHFDHLRRQ
jgi:hypothetical protein